MRERQKSGAALSAAITIFLAVLCALGAILVLPIWVLVAASAATLSPAAAIGVIVIPLMLFAAWDQRRR